MNSGLRMVNLLISLEEAGIKSYEITENTEDEFNRAKVLIKRMKQISKPNETSTNTEQYENQIGFLLKNSGLTATLKAMNMEQLKVYADIFFTLKLPMKVFNFDTELLKLWRDTLDQLKRTTKGIGDIELRDTFEKHASKPDFKDNVLYFLAKNGGSKVSAVNSGMALLGKTNLLKTPLEIWEKTKLSKNVSSLTKQEIQEFKNLSFDRRIELINKGGEFKKELLLATMKESYPYLDFSTTTINLFAAEILRNSKEFFKTFVLTSTDEQYGKWINYTNPYSEEKLYSMVAYKNFKREHFEALFDCRAALPQFLKRVDVMCKAQDEQPFKFRKIEPQELIYILSNFNEGLANWYFEVVGIHKFKADEVLKFFKEMKGVTPNLKMVELFKKHGSISNMIKPLPIDEFTVKFLREYGEKKSKLHNYQTQKYCITSNKSPDNVEKELEETLKDEFFREINCSEEFINDNREMILKSIVDGVFKDVKYFCSSQKAYHSVGMAYKAYVANKEVDFKYGFGNGLASELMDEPPVHVKENWMKDAEFRNGNVHVKEDITFETSFYIGERPISTCQSWKDGSYRNCLPSFFDSTKKLATCWEDGVIKARAIMRLTRIPKVGSKLAFVDIESGNDSNEKDASGDVVLFLERAFAGDMNKHRPLLIELASRKASMMGVKLYVSGGYYNYDDFKKYTDNGYTVKRIRQSFHINHSKNGAQYLDSFGGSGNASTSGGFKEVDVYIIEKK